jgi:hypothetical protein
MSRKKSQESENTEEIQLTEEPVSLEELVMSKKTQKKQVIRPKKETIIELSPKITFRAFFQKKVSSGELKPWQDKTLLFFFKKNGLSEQETENTYEKMLKIF